MKSLRGLALGLMAGGVVLSGSAARGDTPAPRLLAYPFAAGQEWRVSHVDTSRQNPMVDGKVASAGQVVTRELDFRLKVESVAAGGEATIAVTYSRMSVVVTQAGFAIRLDTAKPVPDSNPEIVRLPQFSAALPKLEKNRSMLMALVGLSFHVVVSPAGRVLSVDGLDDVGDAVRERLGSQVADAAQRAQFDSMLEGMLGADEGRQYASALFVPLAAQAVGRREAWSVDQTVPLVFEPLGQWKLPATLIYFVEYGGGDEPMLVMSQMHWGAIEQSKGSRLEMQNGGFSYDAVLEPRGDGIAVRQIESSSVWNVRISTLAADGAATTAAEFQILRSTSVRWNAGQADRPVAPAPDDWVARGQSAAAQGSLEAAIDAFDRALIARPESGEILNRRADMVDALLRRAENEYENGDSAAAARDFDESVALSPNEPEAFYGRACCEASAGQSGPALQDLSQTIALNPRHVTALARRGWLLTTMGRAADGIADLTRATQLDASNAHTFFFLGLALLASQDAKGALSAFTQSLALDPKSARAYFFRSVAWSVAGDQNSGAQDFARACALDPSLAGAGGDELIAQVLAPVVHAIQERQKPSARP